jgi:cysteine-rich repeat protein
VVSSSVCITVCGDNITAGTEQCDDGNTADGDGCNRDCTTGNNNGCAKETPYRDPVTNSCVTACPNRFFPDTTAYTCLACFYTCDTCTNATDCVTCSAATFRTLNGTQCSPLPGYYDNTVIDALPCVSPCVNCTSASSCLSCVTGYYLSGTSCPARRSSPTAQPAQQQVPRALYASWATQSTPLLVGATVFPALTSTVCNVSQLPRLALFV